MINQEQGKNPNLLSSPEIGHLGILIQTLLFKHRIDQSINQADLAKNIGIAQATLSRIKYGKGPISAARVLEILSQIADTPQDWKLIDQLIVNSPRLQKEWSFWEEFENLGDIIERGDMIKIAKATGLSYDQVYSRMERILEIKRGQGGIFHLRKPDLSP